MSQITYPNHDLRYYLTRPGEVEKRVTLAEWIAAEKGAGFHGHGPDGDRPATAGFLGFNGVRGRIQYVRKQAAHEPG